MDDIKQIVEKEKQLMKDNNASVVQQEQEPVIAQEQQQKTTVGVINQQEQDLLGEIEKKTKFIKRGKNVLIKTANAELERREIVALSQEQQNELAKLQLKLNKKTMRDEAKAQHYDRKRKAKMLRYGYLYTPYEVELIDPETGEIKKETRYKNFTVNNFINHYKEFANFYANLADDTKKIIKKTIKIAFWLAIAAAIGVVVYFGVRWLLNNPFIQQIVQNNTEDIAKIFPVL